MRRLWVLLVLALGCGGKDEQACQTFIDDLGECYDGFCDEEGADTAFCGCWEKGQHLDTFTCQCATLDLTTRCDGLDLSEYEQGDGNCSAATEGIENLCTGD